MDFDSYIRMLENAKTEISNDVEQALKKNVLEIQAQSQALCPVDLGTLRRSINSHVKEEGNLIVGEVFTDVYYASYIEFGTGKIGESTNVTDNSFDYRQDGWVYPLGDGEFRYTEGQPAKMFMFTALEQNKEQIKQDIKKAIGGK